jgi:hypothetical protein
MKALGIGLAAVLALAAVATSAFAAPANISPDARKAGMAAAPALVSAAKLNCTITDAFMIGSASDPQSKAKQSFYEVSCKEGMGYVLVSTQGQAAPQYFDCEMETQLQNGKPNNLACKLPGNQNPAAGLQPLLAATGRSCIVDKARYIGSTNEQDLYEVTCQGGGGYIVRHNKADNTAVAQLCMMFGSGSNVSCTLSTPEQQAAAVDALAAGATPRPCQVANRRYVGSTADGTDFFEVACSDKSGFILQVAKSGKVEQAIDCIKAAGFAGGCTLTDTRQAQTEQNAVYTDLAKKAGFDCAVVKYAAFPNREDGSEVVELQCSNRPDGGVGIFPPKGQPQVMNCLRAGAAGYACSFTDFKPLLPKLSAQLSAKGKGSCVVSDARPYAQTNKGSDLIEVACADGGPGWVMVFPAGQTEPSELLNCTQAGTMGGGGCQLATNKK